MISSAFKVLIVKLLGEGQCGLVVCRSCSWSLILSRCCSSCINLQELLFAWQGPGMPQHKRTKMADARWDSSWPLECSWWAGSSRVYSFSNHSWSSAKNWALRCPYAIQLFRQSGHAQNASAEGATAFLNLHFSFGWVHVGYWPGSPVQRRQRRGWHVRGLLIPGSASHHLELSAPSWFGHTNRHVGHFCSTWGMGDALRTKKQCAPFPTSLS